MIIGSMEKGFQQFDLLKLTGGTPGQDHHALVKVDRFSIFEKREKVLFLRPDGKFVLVDVAEAGEKKIEGLVLPGTMVQKWGYSPNEVAVAYIRGCIPMIFYGSGHEVEIAQKGPEGQGFEDNFKFIYSCRGHNASAFAVNALPDGYGLEIVKAMVTEDKASVLKEKYETWFGKKSNRSDLTILVTNLLAAIQAMRMMGQEMIQELKKEAEGMEAMEFMEAAKYQFAQQFGPDEKSRTVPVENEEEKAELQALFFKSVTTMIAYMKVVLGKIYSQTNSVGSLNPGVVANCHAMWKMIFDMLDAPGLKIVAEEDEEEEEIRRVVRGVDTPMASTPLSSRSGAASESVSILKSETLLSSVFDTANVDEKVVKIITKWYSAAASGASEIAKSDFSFLNETGVVKGAAIKITDAEASEYIQAFYDLGLQKVIDSEDAAKFVQDIAGLNKQTAEAGGADDLMAELAYKKYQKLYSFAASNAPNMGDKGKQIRYTITAKNLRTLHEWLAIVLTRRITKEEVKVKMGMKQNQAYDERMQLIKQKAKTHPGDLDYDDLADTFEYLATANNRFDISTFEEVSNLINKVVIRSNVKVEDQQFFERVKEAIKDFALALQQGRFTLKMKNAASVYSTQAQLVIERNQNGINAVVFVKLDRLLEKIAGLRIQHFETEPEEAVVPAWDEKYKQGPERARLQCRSVKAPSIVYHGKGNVPEFHPWRQGVTSLREWLYAMERKAENSQIRQPGDIARLAYQMFPNREEDQANLQRNFPVENCMGIKDQTDLDNFFEKLIDYYDPTDEADDAVAAKELLESNKFCQQEGQKVEIWAMKVEKVIMRKYRLSVLQEDTKEAMEACSIIFTRMINKRVKDFLYFDTRQIRQRGQIRQLVARIKMMEEVDKFGKAEWKNTMPTKNQWSDRRYDETYHSRNSQRSFEDHSGGTTQDTDRLERQKETKEIEKEEDSEEEEETIFNIFDVGTFAVTMQESGYQKSVQLENWEPKPFMIKQHQLLNVFDENTDEWNKPDVVPIDSVSLEPERGQECAGAPCERMHQQVVCDLERTQRPLLQNGVTQAPKNGPVRGNPPEKNVNCQRSPEKKKGQVCAGAPWKKIHRQVVCDLERTQRPLLENGVTQAPENGPVRGNPPDQNVNCQLLKSVELTQVKKLQKKKEISPKKLMNKNIRDEYDLKSCNEIEALELLGLQGTASEPKGQEKEVNDKDGENMVNTTIAFTDEQHTVHGHLTENHMSNFFTTIAIPKVGWEANEKVAAKELYQAKIEAEKGEQVGSFQFTTALVDSGSGKTLMRKDLFDMVNESNALKLNQNMTTVKAANGQTMQVSGCFLADFILDTKRWDKKLISAPLKIRQVNVIVVEKSAMSLPLICGEDFLARLQKIGMFVGNTIMGRKVPKNNLVLNLKAAEKRNWLLWKFSEEKPAFYYTDEVKEKCVNERKQVLKESMSLPKYETLDIKVRLSGWLLKDQKETMVNIYTEEELPADDWVQETLIGLPKKTAQTGVISPDLVVLLNHEHLKKNLDMATVSNVKLRIKRVSKSEKRFEEAELEKYLKPMASVTKGMMELCLGKANGTA